MAVRSETDRQTEKQTHHLLGTLGHQLHQALHCTGHTLHIHSKLLCSCQWQKRTISLESGLEPNALILEMQLESFHTRCYRIELGIHACFDELDR